MATGTDAPRMNQEKAELSAADNRVLLSCARCLHDLQADVCLVEDFGSEVHWQRVLTAAQQNHLLPLLYDRLSKVDAERVPAWVRAHLKSTYYSNLLRNHRLLDALGQVVGALRQGGVETIVLKGGALAPTVYANPALRPMNDLDLLVRSQQQEAAGAVLSSIGFRTSTPVPHQLVPFQRRYGGGIEWQREENGKATRLDLQHDLVGVDWCRNSFPIDNESLWSRVRPLAVGEIAAWQLSPEDNLIHLCLHPILHHGGAWPLIGYVDIDRVIAKHSSASFWTSLVQRAISFRVRTAVYWGLSGARTLFEAPVPDGVLAALEPSGVRLRALRHQLPPQLGAILHRVDRPVGGVSQLLLYGSLMDSIGDVGAMLKAIVFPDLEWLSVRYSLENGDQAWRYRLIHPFRVARALVRGLTQTLVESSLE